MDTTSVLIKDQGYFVRYYIKHYLTDNPIAKTLLVRSGSYQDACTMAMEYLSSKYLYETIRGYISILHDYTPDKLCLDVNQWMEDHPDMKDCVI